jgi:hypothetical protein
LFGIEDFREKPNGNGTIWEFLHPNIARGSRAAAARERRACGLRPPLAPIAAPL